MANTTANYQAQIDALLAENARLRAAQESKNTEITVKVSGRGAISVYGLNGRFPLTVYVEQLRRLNAVLPAITAFADAAAEAKFDFASMPDDCAQALGIADRRNVRLAAIKSESGDMKIPDGFELTSRTVSYNPSNDGDAAKWLAKPGNVLIPTLRAKKAA